MRRGELSPDGTRYYDSDAWGWQELWLSADAVITAARSTFGVPAAAAELLSEGYLNQSWRLHGDDHDRVLRVSRSERTLDQVRYEYELTSAWAREIASVISAEVPSVVVAGRVLTLFPYCDGVPGTVVDPSIRARQLSGVMARMHRISLGLALPQREGWSALDDRPVADLWGRVRSAILDRFGAGREVLDPITAVDRAVERTDALIMGWRASGRLDLRAAVHADLNARNQIYRGVQLVGIVDSDDCRVEPLISEVSGLAYSDPSARPEVVWRDYLDAGGPLHPRDEELLLPFAQHGALGEMQWCLDDHGVATHLAMDHVRDIVTNVSGSPVRG